MSAPQRELNYKGGEVALAWLDASESRWHRRKNDAVCCHMLTRLKVSGFKNLVGVDVSFGPFTCVAGPNGVGKSNLFDAIRFLSELADRDLLAAALSVRGGGKTADVRSLFHRVGNKWAERIDLEAEMIVPQKGRDDLGQLAEASMTFVRYRLELGYREEDAAGSPGRLEIRHESLNYISRGDAPNHLPFLQSRHGASARWRKSVVVGERRKPYISTITNSDGLPVIQLHQERAADQTGNLGRRTRGILASSLPRTVLSTATNAAEARTAVMTRHEMKSWRLLQLEPSALREPSGFTDPVHLGADGSYLPATLYHLARGAAPPPSNPTAEAGAARVYATVSNRLAQLITDVSSVSVDRDVSRELLTLRLTDMNKTTHAARSLSDGTLRFLALAVMEQDPESRGLLCLEEPENGISPSRIPAMIKLLEDLAVKVSEPVSEDNPLRQVIINTHSPGVVLHVPDDSLLVVLSRRTRTRDRVAEFAWLSVTWRALANPDVPALARGELGPYLGSTAEADQGTAPDGSVSSAKRVKGIKRVKDRMDLLQGQLDFSKS